MLVALLLSVVSAAAPSLQSQLSAVNPGWCWVAPDPALLAPARFHSEQEVLRAHLSGVLKRLRADTSTLTPALHQARLRNLALLTDYLDTQECPHNHSAPRRVPVMVDREGRHCPVAALMSAAGEEDFIQQVARTANNVLVRDIRAPRFLAWAASSGLTLDELAWIQPAYSPDTRWHVAALGKGSATPSRKELRHLQPIASAFDSPGDMPEEPQLATLLSAHGVALEEWNRHAEEATPSAAPTLFRGALYSAALIRHEEGEPEYVLERWTDGHPEIVHRFAVPIRALGTYRGRLYAGGGRHPFLAGVEAPPEEAAFITSFDGDSWRRLRTGLQGEVRGFATVRGNLCAAVTYYIPPG